MVRIFTPAYGTTLEGMGVPNSHEMSSAVAFTKPEWRTLLQNLTNDYVRMGQSQGKHIDGIMTHTFRCSPHFARGCVTEFNKRAAEIALSAREQYGTPEMEVYGAVGPTGRNCYDHSLTPSFIDEIMGYHYLQVRALKEAGVNGLWPETINTVREGIAIVTLAKEFSLPVYLSFVLHKEDGGKIRDGTPFSDAIRHIDAKTNSYAQGYLANCSSIEKIATTAANVSHDELGQRIAGFYPNASNRDPGELDGCEGNHQDVPVGKLIGFAREMQQGHPQIKWDKAWISGCCGYGKDLEELVVALK